MGSNCKCNKLTITLLKILRHAYITKPLYSHSTYFMHLSIAIKIVDKLYYFQLLFHVNIYCPLTYLMWLPYVFSSFILINPIKGWCMYIELQQVCVSEILFLTLQVYDAHRVSERKIFDEWVRAFDIIVVLELFKSNANIFFESLWGTRILSYNWFFYSHYGKQFTTRK